VTNLGAFSFQAVPDSPQYKASQPASSDAPPAQGAAPGGALGGLLFPLLLFLPIILILFWQSRSQQKKQEATLSSLKTGDRVLTQSGLVGRLLAIEGRYAKLELPPSGTKVTILKSGLLGRDTDEAPAGKEKEAAPSAEKSTSEKSTAEKSEKKK
jgi:preprotein translocase subunit YajC